MKLAEPEVTLMIEEVRVDLELPSNTAVPELIWIGVDAAENDELAVSIKLLDCKKVGVFCKLKEEKPFIVSPEVMTS